MAGSDDPIGRLHQLLDTTDDTTVGTSMRIPVALRDAAALAVEELGVASSTTALTAEALRSRLTAIAVQASLDAHYDEHPHLRPTLADLAIAAAELDGNPLAVEPGLLQEAADAVVTRHPDADADDVLLWAEARSFTTA